LGSNFPSTGYSSEELSEEEIIFDKSVMERNKESSKSASPRTTPEASSGRSRSDTSTYQSPDHAIQEQKIWALTQTPKSTPLMAVPTLNDSPGTEIWTSKEISETKSPDSSFTATSLSDSSNVKPTEAPPSVSLTSVSLISQASETEVRDSDLAAVTRLSGSTYDLTDKDSSPPFAAQSRPGPAASSKQTTFVSSLSPHPSEPSLSLLPTASNESTPSITMAGDGTSPSAESCKTPVAARNEVVIAMDEDEKNIIYQSDKSGGEVLSVVKDASKGLKKAEMVITMRLHDEEESSTQSESKSESSVGETVNTSLESEMKNVKTSDAIIDIMGSDNENEETFTINEKSNQGKLLVRSRRYIIDYSSPVKFVFEAHTILQPRSQNIYRSKG